MKINDLNRTGAIRQYRNPYDRSSSGHVGGLYKGKDEISISPEAKELLEASGKDNDARIDELKRAVSSGNYRVDAQKIADKLLQYFDNQP